MNEITIKGVFGSWEVDAESIIHQLKYMDGDVLVEIDSIGGSVIVGIAVHNAFKSYKKGKITFRITGVAASIAGYVVMSGDSVEAYDNVTFMIHNAFIPIMGDHHALRKGADLAEGLSSVISKAYVSKTGMKEDEIRSLMDDETFYFGEEIKTAGFVDTIISTDTNLTKAEAMSVSLESLKACNNAIRAHESEFSFEAVAQLLPPKETIEEIKPKVVDVSAQSQRSRNLEIITQGINL